MLRVASRVVPLLLGGCAIPWLIPHSRDLLPVALDFVDLNRQPEAQRGIEPPRDAPPRPALRVVLTTRTDFVRLSLDYGATIQEWASYCDAPAIDQDRLLATGFGVFDALGNVEWRRAAPAASPADATGRHRYHLYLRATRPRGWAFRSEELYIAYDLTQATSDVCLLIRGGKLLGGTFRSNVVRIPAAAIRAALAPP